MPKLDRIDLKILSALQGNGRMTNTALADLIGLSPSPCLQRVEPLMDVRHVANAVVHMASLPLDANVQFMTIMATKMPFIGRG